MGLLFQFLSMAITIEIWLIIIRALLSFFPHSSGQYVIRFIYDVTNPILNPIQKIIPPLGGLDFSPVFAILVLSAIQRLLYMLQAYI